MKKNGNDVHSALKVAHEQGHADLGANSIDDAYSGTTAATLLLEGNSMFVSNVGDSSVILGTRCDIKKMKAQELSENQTPLRLDERERICASGGEVMTTDQRDGDVPMNEDWNLSDKAPRVWAKGQKLPGCGFSRSIGDSFAHSIGVSATPEVTEHVVDKMDHVLVVCSDGITEWQSPQVIIDFVSNFDDPVEAAATLVREATQHWIDRGDYMDDITAVVVILDDEPGYEMHFKAVKTRERRHSEREQAKHESKKAVALELPDEHKVLLIGAAGDPSQQEYDDLPLTNEAIAWTVFAGALSGFLGGLCGIRGPPIILYFIHPPACVRFTKKSQLATGAAITLVNVSVRIIYYLATIDSAEAGFHGEDWGLYLSVFFCSIVGVLLGSEVFSHMKDARPTIRAILAIFLLMCGISLFVSAFTD